MKLLFQGDSITDAGRDRTDPHNLGHGYPFYAAEELKRRWPEKEFEFVNLGVGGDQTKDLVARLQSDFIDQQPDIVSILIGVNDTWHHAAAKDWIPGDVFEARYRTVLEAIKQRTNARIMMIEPFIVPVNEERCSFYVDLFPKIQIIRALAREFADAYLPLDGLLAALAVTHPLSDFSNDGVHPNASGSQIIGQLYAEAIAPLIL